MSYYHDLFQQFDNCPVSVAFLDSTDWRHLAVTPARKFLSLLAAVDYILDQKRDLELIVVTAHPAAGAVDFSRVELASLVALIEDNRNCQD